MQYTHPTADTSLNSVLGELVAGAQAALGQNFVSAYLQGSFAVGDWDPDSDVDFLVVVEHAVASAALEALRSLHARLFALPSPWAQHLEGSYVPLRLLRRADATQTPFLFIDNTSQELEWSTHDNTLVVRWVTREHGVTLAGPSAPSLIEPVAADALRREVREKMRVWAEAIRSERYRITNRWAQPYVTLSYCRMLHTLETGRIASKPAGAAWATRTLDRRWASLIQRAWEDRPNPSLKVRLPAAPDDIAATLAFIRYALARSGQGDE
jgi:hypothetical protein